MQEAGYFLYFLIFYIFLLVFLPAKVLRLSLWGKDAVENGMKALLVGYTVCVSLVYWLALAHIYHPVTLWLGLAFTMFVYGGIKKVNYGKWMMQTLHTAALFGGGQYKVSVFVRRKLKSVWKSFAEGVVGFFKRLTVMKLVYLLLFTAAFLILLSRRLPSFLNIYAYMTSDMYVHNEWINYMEAGDIFYDGIYPFGMHNMISALHYFTGLHMNRIFRYYGAVNSVLTPLAAIYFLYRISRTKATVLIYMVLYGVTDFVGNVYCYRMIFTLPQEWAMPFMLPALWFLGKFLQEKKREDGIYFALAASLVVSGHFFTAIFAVVLCGGLGITYLAKIFKEKLWLPLLCLLFLIICLSMLPFLAGKLEGKYWQGSMNWALSVMQTKQEDKKESGLTLEAENEKILEEAQTEGAEEEIAEKEPGILYQFFYMMVEKMYAFWGYVFWGGVLFAAVYLLLCGKRLTDWRRKYFFAVWLTVMFCVLLIGYWIVGLPQLMKEERVRMFIGYFAPMLMALPAEAVAEIWKRRGRAAGELMGLAGTAFCFYATYGMGNIPFQTYFYLETSTAAEACVKIAEEYEKDTWTVVSPVEELSLVRGNGFHYELWEFITRMERYEPDRYVEIPTKYVFFILEKKPIPYNVTRIAGNTYNDLPVDCRDAQRVVTREMLGISENGAMKFYNTNENRRALEAKLKAWLETYSELFPEQMSVYMESEDCVIYRLEQNIFAWNNLAVDYGYNVISDEDYERMLTEN